MAIKMRTNVSAEAVCCECKHKRSEVLDMFDLCIGGKVFTICDECNGKLLNKCLNADVKKSSKVKSQSDLKIISKRRDTKTSKTIAESLRGYDEYGNVK